MGGCGWDLGMVDGMVDGMMVSFYAAGVCWFGIFFSFGIVCADWNVLPLH